MENQEKILNKFKQKPKNIDIEKQTKYLYLYFWILFLAHTLQLLNC